MENNADGFEYYNKIPEEIADMRASDLGIWVTGISGKEYFVPHHSEGDAVPSRPRLVRIS